MENELIKLSASYGIFGALFVYLLRYVLQKNDEREQRYQATIDKLADKFNIVEDIRKDVSEIKESINK